MKIFTKKENKQLELLLYKLLNDALFLWIVFFLGLLISEGLLPGFVSGYVSFTKMTFILFALLGAIGYLGKTNNLSFDFFQRPKISKNKTLVVLLVLSFALIINSLRGIGWLEMIIISFGTFIALALLYKILILEEK
jgi:hypothetical protein